LVEAQQDAEVIAVGRSPANNTSFHHEICLGTKKGAAPLPDIVRRPWLSDWARYEALDLSDRSEDPAKDKQNAASEVPEHVSAMSGVLPCATCGTQ
jgi:hypothetical protein